MEIKKYSDQKDIISLHKELTGEKLNKDKTYIFYKKDIMIWYAVFFIEDQIAKINWFYWPWNGKKLYKLLQKKLKLEKVKAIELNISIDPNEDKIHVIKRINFWFGFWYKAIDIDFRKKFWPKLAMKKEF